MGELTIKQAAERSKKIREHYRSFDGCGACRALDDGAAGTLAGWRVERSRFGAQNRRKHLVADGVGGPDGYRQRGRTR